MLTTVCTPVFSSSWRRGSPSIETNTVGSSVKRMIGGLSSKSVAARPCCSAISSEAMSSSSDSSRSQVGISAVSRSANSFCCSSVASWNRTCGTRISSNVTVRVSRSVSIRPSSQAAPKIGSSCPVGLIDTADRPDRTSPSRTSSWGW